MSDSHFCIQKHGRKKVSKPNPPNTDCVIYDKIKQKAKGGQK